MYHFIWHTYCDWYIEFAKIHFQNSSKETEETKKVAIWVFVQILKMAHPIMPFITERLWSFINKDSSFLMNELFTKFQINNQFNASQIYFKKLIQVISTVRNFRSELNVPYKELIDINFSNNDNDFIKFLHIYENELIRLLKLKRISFDAKTDKILGAAYLVVEKTTLTIPLKNIVDTKKEIQKLQIKKQKEISNFNQLENKLKNSAFINNASEEVIEKFKKQSIDIKSSIEKIDQIIDTINR